MSAKEPKYKYTILQQLEKNRYTDQQILKAIMYMVCNVTNVTLSVWLNLKETDNEEIPPLSLLAINKIVANGVDYYRNLFITNIKF